MLPQSCQLHVMRKCLGKYLFHLLIFLVNLLDSTTHVLCSTCIFCVHLNYQVIRGLRQGQLNHLWHKLQKRDASVKTRASVSVAILVTRYLPESHYSSQSFYLIDTSTRLLGKPYCNGLIG